VGSEAYSLRRAEKRSVSRENPLRIEPGETVLVLTDEFLVVTPKFTGLLLARARIMGEGLALTSARIDPTWYGKLHVAVTNNANAVVTLRHGEAFCTVGFGELGERIPKERYLTKKSVPFLGQTVLEYAPSHATPWKPARPESVALADLDRIVELFGPPFDIVKGSIYRVKEDIISWMEERWAPTALRDLKHSVWQEEIEVLKKSLDDQRRSTNYLIVTLLILVVGWLVALFFKGR